MTEHDVTLAIGYGTGGSGDGWYVQVYVDGEVVHYEGPFKSEPPAVEYAQALRTAFDKGLTGWETTFSTGWIDQRATKGLPS